MEFPVIKQSIKAAPEAMRHTPPPRASDIDVGPPGPQVLNETMLLLAIRQLSNRGEPDSTKTPAPSPAANAHQWPSGGAEPSIRFSTILQFLKVGELPMTFTPAPRIVTVGNPPRLEISGVAVPPLTVRF